MPDDAALLGAPPRVALPGFVPMASVMLSVAVGTVLPNWSWTATATTGEMMTPATTFDGCVVNPSLVAAPAAMVNPALTTLCKDTDDATSVHGPALSMLMLLNVA